MFCAIQNPFHHGARRERWLVSLLRALRALRDEARLRFTRLDVALHHLTLLDVFGDYAKRSHWRRAEMKNAEWRTQMQNSALCIRIQHSENVPGCSGVFQPSCGMCPDVPECASAQRSDKTKPRG